MDPQDAQANLQNAIDSAASLTDEQKVALQLSMVSLDKAVSIVLAGREKETCGDKFQFVPPTRSVAFLRAAMDELERRASAPPSMQGAPKARTAAVTENTSGGLLFPE